MKVSSASNPVVLARSPEMAVVDLLDSASSIAMQALFAANPEMESGEFLLEIPEPSVQACLADALLVQINGLQAAIRSYRTYVVEHQERIADTANPDF